MYIRDQSFDPLQFYAYGRPCPVICEVEKNLHSRYRGKTNSTDAEVRCNKCHHWLRKKTIADVVEALVGAFIVDSGFKAAAAFLKWIGIQVDVIEQQLSEVCLASKAFLPLADLTDISTVENLLGYDFFHKGLLIQAFVHPSYNNRSGGCYQVCTCFCCIVNFCMSFQHVFMYFCFHDQHNVCCLNQRLEFLGDAVLDYLITSYLYSVYPELKPGQFTDLRSMCVSNISFGEVAGRWSFHKLIICNSKDLRNSMTKYVDSIGVSASGGAQIEEKTSPKVVILHPHSSFYMLV